MTQSAQADLVARIAQLEEKLADLRARMPAHTTPPSMIAEMDDLEEALAKARQQLREQETKGTSNQKGDAK